LHQYWCFCRRYTGFETKFCGNSVHFHHPWL
jgi:hypothetical protein